MLLKLGEALWGMPTVFLLLFVGIFFTVGTKAFIFLHPVLTVKEVFSSLFGGSSQNKTVISPFEALCTALAGTLGTGNMAGTAAAIALGGPGAVFWMMVCALFGMMTKCAECTLAVHFRQKTKRGYVGGAMYYMRDGLGGAWRFIATGFAAAMALSSLGTTAVQPYMMASSIEKAFGIEPAATVTAASFLCAAVIFTGSRGSAKFCSLITPLLCFLYVGGCFAALFIQRGEILHALALIVTEAFSPAAAAGGVSGAAIRKAMSEGFSKSTFTHEAGMGAAPMVHATADCSCGASQGMLGAVEVFVDTLVICLLTALVILTAGDISEFGKTPGIEMTMEAFKSVLGEYGEIMISICCVLFAFSTMVGWIFEFETSMRWIFGEHPIIYRILYLLPPILVTGKSPEWIWHLADVCTGLVVIPNAVAIMLLSGEFFPLFNSYCQKIKAKDKTQRKLI